MNKLLSEVVRGYWMISDEEANALLPVVQKILSGEKFDELKKNYNLKFFDVNQTTVFVSNDGWEPTSLNSIPKNSTVVVPINGVLTKYDNCGYYGMQSLASLIIQLADSPNVDAIVLNIDSPGGSADGSFDLAEAVKYAKSKMPVVSFIDGLMASAAYRGGMNVDLIIQKPGSVVGSIGTMFSTRIYKNDSVIDVSVNADSSPEKNLAFEKLIKENDATLIKETLLNPMNEIFLKEVKLARPNVDEDALKGGTYVGKSAKKMGLVDKEGTLQTALQEAQKLVKQRQKININSTNMSFKSKFPGIAAFLGMTDEFAENKETLTPEEIHSLEAIAGENARLKNELNAAKTAQTAKESELTALIAERDEWKQKAEEFGAQPGSIGAATVLQTEKNKKYDFSHIKDMKVREHYEKTWN